MASDKQKRQEAAKLIDEAKNMVIADQPGYQVKIDKAAKLLREIGDEETAKRIEKRTLDYRYFEQIIKGI